MSQIATPPEPSPLPSPPSDGITNLSYLPSIDATKPSSILAASSWDGTVRLYDTKLMSNVCTHNMESGPLLGLAVDRSGKTLFTGGIDGSGESSDTQVRQDGL